MISLPDKPKAVSKKGNQSVFEITPFYPGYGVTIGNSLRRVLLSSLEGAAITSIKIKGVSHEFSTIPGVLEDVLELISNIKKVRIKLFTDEPVTMTLAAKGEKKITAEDIDAPSSIKIVNPDQHIATITDKKAELEIEMTAEKGIGYVPVEQRQKEKLSVGMITIDAIFSPVEFVNFTVENIRVGQRTDFNKVLMEIRTDGSITPEQALNQAAKILINHFQAVMTNEGDSDGQAEAEGMLNEGSAEEEKPKKKTRTKKSNKSS